MNSQGVAIDKTLVERLRNLAEEWFEMCDDIHEPLYEAATRIEALEAALRNIQTLAKKRQAEGGPDGNLKAIEGFAEQALENKP